MAKAASQTAAVLTSGLLLGELLLGRRDRLDLAAHGDPVVRNETPSAFSGLSGERIAS
jgi:hypothetical protein